MTYYVAITGNDINPGTLAKPWRTLKHAIAKVPSGTIQVSAGTFVESGLLEVPIGVSIAGAGSALTVFKASSPFYYHPPVPDYQTDHFLFRLMSTPQANGNQSLKGFSIDGDSKQLHGGIYVYQRDNVFIDDVKVSYTNFTGIWLWGVQYSILRNSSLLNCSWGNSNYSSGALNVGNLDHVCIDHLSVDENTGYGIKAIGPSINSLSNVSVSNCRVSVNPTGLWSNGKAPNIALEWHDAALSVCNIGNSYFDNTVSLVNKMPSTGLQSVIIKNNIFDMETRAGGAGYSVELTVNDIEIVDNRFLKGSYGIANWEQAVKGWNIHGNTVYGIQGQYPGEFIRVEKSGLHNVKICKNTVILSGKVTSNIIGLYGGISDGVEIKDNTFIDVSTANNFYPNEFIHLENGATLSAPTIENNVFIKLPPYQGNLGVTG